jgi:poly(A) polymerase
LSTRPLNVDCADERRSVTLPDDPMARAAVEVVAALRAAGHSAYLVGGCVRDLVLGLPPKDYDVATAARPEDVAATFRRVAMVGAAFGVVRVLQPVDDGVIDVEVATFRADVGYSDSRRPDAVRFTDAREDVLRRDFTLNGMLLDPLDADGTASAHAEVVDLVGGLADLHAGLLRAIGTPRERFEEDALRLLRAVRFAARFGLRIEADTAAAITDGAATLAAISAERISAELEGMLRPPHAALAVRLLQSLGLAQVLFPALVAVDPGLERAARRVEALTASVRWSDDATGEHDGDADAGFVADHGLGFPLALCGLLWEVRPEDSRRALAELGEQLRLSSHQLRQLGGIWRQASALAAPLDSHAAGDRLPHLDAANPSLARLLREPDADAALRLLLAEADNRPDWPASVRPWLRGLRRLRAETPRRRWWPTPHVDGRQLMALGHRPGPDFRAALDAALDVQLAGGDADAALTAALARLESGSEVG